MMFIGEEWEVFEGPKTPNATLSHSRLNFHDPDTSHAIRSIQVDATLLKPARVSVMRSGG